MFWFIISLACAFCVSTEGYVVAEARIVGGAPIEISEAPYAVSIWMYYFENKIKSQHSCGGSLISESIVVSAGHCVPSQDLSRYVIRAGSKLNNIGGQYAEVSKIILHENYTNDGLLDAYNDISLLFLKTPFEFNKYVAPISIPDQDLQVPDGAMVSVAGWGYTGFTEDHKPILTNVLRYIQIPIVNQKACSKMFIGLRENQICAGDMESKTSCNGDSGSGLVWNNLLTGIVSLGRNKCSGAYPAVYTRVSAFSPWIHKHIQHLI